MQAADLLKPAHTEIEGAKRNPLAYLWMGHTIREQNFGACCRHPEPAQGKLHRKTPLPWADPDISLGKLACERAERKFVLQAGCGGQHD